MKLNDVLKNIQTFEIVGSTNVEVKHLSIDSRNIKPGGLFFAVSGTKVDGHAFIDTAIEFGAKTIVCEKLPENLNSEVVYVRVANTSEIIGLMAKNFFGNNDLNMKIVGVTGTNGKTTIATMLYQLFTSLGYKTGLLSTVENIIGGEVLTATHTTGDAIQIQENLAKMREIDTEYCFMEVSSHAVDQKRIAGIDFTGGIFTNLTQDHLDYHQTLDDYAKAKKAFFDGLPDQAFALYNSDDNRGSFMVANTRAKKLSYGHMAADFVFTTKKSSAEGLELVINDTAVKTPLVGEFNAYNVAAIFAAATTLGAKTEDVVSGIAKLRGARGRMEKVVGKSGVFGVVDYAHTPDALENALKTINGFKTEKVVTVFGAGGDRDKTKRPLMGEIAARLGDYSIVTSDNPRNENPEDIIADILAGIKDKTNVETILDRREAIRRAVEIAKPGDIILVAGKGHEDYQDIAGAKSHFSDIEILKEFLS